VLCSCSHAADPVSFRDACVRGIVAARRRGAILREGGAGPDHPAHFALAETSYLKALFFRLD
jgi:23S rRNA (cytosine1962-C5)-methyltransferase